MKPCALLFAVAIGTVGTGAYAAEPMSQPPASADAKARPAAKGKKPMKMKEPMAGGMKKQGMMKEDMKKGALKKGEQMKGAMQQEKMKP